MNQLLKILMIEDSADDVKFVKRALEKDGLTFDLQVVDCRCAFETHLYTFCPDLVISDHSLPQFSSFEALAIFKESKLDIPFILVTGAVSEEYAVTILKSGADDYILKTNLSKLPVAIKSALEKYQFERGRKLAEEALRLRNEELVKINQEMDNFVYKSSHNLRAPLMSIRGLMNIVKMESKEGDHQYFDLIEQSIQRMDNNLQEILDYSRNSRLSLQISPIDIEAVFNKCLDELGYMLTREEFSATIRVAGRADFFCDEARLKVILINILSNCLRFRDASKGKLTLHMAVSINETEAVMTVSDNGAGIDPAHQKKIFDMFYRAHESTVGSGLGLFIVKEVVDKLGGAISVRSALGKGTTFTITVPNSLSVDLALAAY